MPGLLTIAIQHSLLARPSLRERMLGTSNMVSEPVVGQGTVEQVYSTECTSDDSGGIENSVPFLHLIALVVHCDNVNASYKC